MMEEADGRRGGLMCPTSVILIRRTREYTEKKFSGLGSYFCFSFRLRFVIN